LNYLASASVYTNGNLVAYVKPFPSIYDSKLSFQSDGKSAALSNLSNIFKEYLG